MNSKFKQTAKRLISGFVAATTAITFMPQIPAFAETGATTYSYDGYDVEYSVLNEWDSGQTVEIKVTNTGDDSILNWAVKYDAQGEISNLWNAAVYDNQGEDYIIKNSGWNYEIAPGQTVNFGYTLVDDKFETPDDFELCSKRVGVAIGYEAALNIIEQWNTGIKGEIVITNTSDEPLEAWTYSFDSNFTIDNLWDARILDSADNHYTIASEMWTNPIAVGDSKVIGFTASINEDITPEISNGTLTVIEIDSLEIDWEDTTDTDGDGLPDVYEKHYFGSDPKNNDTDGDNLPDGYEVITLYTDPISKDTDDNGTTDDEEDFDSDNLTNYEEYLLGTDPYKADTDGDGLTDGDEVNIYNTDPLKYDTDGDGVIDGDELLLGLDPNDPTDGDTAVKQIINEEELSVNRYNDSFKISIDVEASNNVKRYISQEVSRYSGILSDNRSIIGTPIDIEYNAGTIFSGTVTFNLSDEFIDNNAHFYPELNLGIERYGIFYYDEEVGTIVPLSCEYDADNNNITIDAKNMGNLMVIDFESLMYDLGVQPESTMYTPNMVTTLAIDEENTADDMEVHIAESADAANEVTDFEDLSLEEIEDILNSYVDEGISTFSLSPNRGVDESSTIRQVDLVLVVDTTGSMGSQIYTVKSNLSGLIAKLRNDGITLYVSVVDYRDITCDGKNSTKVNNNSGVDFYSSPDDIAKVIDSLSPWGGGDFEETAIDGLAEANFLEYRKNAAKFVFLITDATYKIQNNHSINNMTDMAQKLQKNGIYTSVVTYPSYYYAYDELATITGGELISMSGDFCNDMYDVIYSRTPPVSVVIANTLTTGFFKEPLVKGGNCDTDGDTLSDSDEIDWKNVKEIYSDGTYSLFTWEELCKKSKAYKEGQKDYYYRDLFNVEVIPATSNPFLIDSDGDYYPDNVDKRKLESDPMYIFDKGIDDTNFHNGMPIEVKSPDKYTDGNLIVDDKKGTARYEFTRKPTDYHYFSLKPNKTSFYKLTAETSFGTQIIVKCKEGFLFPSYVEVMPNEDGLYFLDKGSEYTISIWGNHSNDFTFSIEQQNWVHAPNGAVVDCSIEGSKYTNTVFYLRDETVIDIVEKYYLQTYGLSLKDEDESVLPDDHRKNRAELYADVFFESYGETSAMEQLSLLGDISTVTGFVSLFSDKLGVIGIAATVSGQVIMIENKIYNAQKKKLADAMYNGDFNIKMAVTTYYEKEYPSFKDIYKYDVDWGAWDNGKDGYIYRFLHPKTIFHQPLLVKSIKPVDFYVPQKGEDGRWVLNPI